MDHKLTERIQAYLNSTKKDYDEGALLYLKLSGNRITYRNISFNPAKYAGFIEHELQKYLKFRLASLTNKQNQEMESQVEQIIKARFSAEDSAKSGKSEWQMGKRKDHDSLPSHIRALYDNQPLYTERIRKARHMIESLIESNAACPISELYPFREEIINADKQSRKDWKEYDSFTLNGVNNFVEDPIAASKSAVGFINLNLKKYTDNPTDELREKISASYKLVLNPTDKLKARMKDAGFEV